MKFFASLIRIAIVVAIVNASARLGFAYWAYYELRDDAEQTAMFGADQPEWALHQAVLDKAGELFLPVGEDQVVVTRNGFKTIIQASYVQPIEVFPRRTYPMKFSFSVEGFRVNERGPAGR